MTDLLERTTGSTLVEETRSAPTPERTPPDQLPPVTPSATAPWPSRAKLLIAVLAVATLLGVAGTVIGFTSDDGPTATEQEMESTIATLTAERDSLLAEVADFDTSIATLAGERDELVGEVADLESMVDGAASGREELVDQITELDMAIAELTADRDGLAERVTGYESRVADLRVDVANETERVTGYESRVADLRVDVANETERAITAEAERDGLTALFPITFDASLDDVSVADLAGTYDVSFTEAYCNGFATCGTKLSVDELTLKATSEGYLQVLIDDVATAGLYRVDGALYAVSESTPAIAACGTTPRVARVAVTVFAHGISVADDGTHQVTDLGASLTVQSEALGTCDAGLAFYGTEFTPQP